MIFRINSSLAVFSPQWYVYVWCVCWHGCAQVMCVVVCTLCCGVWCVECVWCGSRKTPSVCRFKTPPCVRSRRLHVYPENARMWTCGRFSRTYGGVLNAHTEASWIYTRKGFPPSLSLLLSLSSFCLSLPSLLLSSLIFSLISFINSHSISLWHHALSGSSVLFVMIACDFVFQNALPFVLYRDESIEKHFESASILSSNEQFWVSLDHDNIHLRNTMCQVVWRILRVWFHDLIALLRRIRHAIWMSKLNEHPRWNTNFLFLHHVGNWFWDLDSWFSGELLHPFLSCEFSWSACSQTIVGFPSYWRLYSLAVKSSRTLWTSVIWPFTLGKLLILILIHDTFLSKFFGKIFRFSVL